MNEEESDRLFLYLIVAFAIGAGVVSFGGLIEAVRPTLLEWKILAVGNAIVIPIDDGSFGIGLVPIIVLAGVLVITIVLGIARSRRRRFIK